MRTIAILTIISLTFLITACASSGKAPQMMGSSVPPARIKMMDGHVRRINQPNGKKKVVMFWATWCHHSRPVIEELSEYAKTDPDAQDVEFIAVSLDDPGTKAQVEERIYYTKLQGFNHAYSGNAAGDEAYHHLSQGDLPHLLVLDENGKLIAEGHSEDIVYEALGDQDKM